MASETVDPIDRLVPPTLHTAVPIELYLYSADVGHKSQDLLQPMGWNAQPSECQATALHVRPLRVYKS